MYGGSRDAAKTFFWLEEWRTHIAVYKPRHCLLSSDLTATEILYACEMCRERGHLCAVVLEKDVLTLLPVHRVNNLKNLGPGDEEYWLVRDVSTASGRGYKAIAPSVGE